MSVNVLCPMCQYLNWSRSLSCERCHAALVGVPSWEHPPLSQPGPSPWFWGVVNAAQGDPVLLGALLGKLSERELYEFQSEYLQAAADLSDELFVAHIEPSEDGAEDISRWAVGRGSQFYSTVRLHPEQLRRGSNALTTPSLQEVAYRVYEQRFGLPLNLL